MKCVVCGVDSTSYAGGQDCWQLSIHSDTKGTCPECAGLEQADVLKCYQLRRIADALESIEKKTKDRNGW